MSAIVGGRPGQWLVTWTLSAFVATLAVFLVLWAATRPLEAQSGFTLVDLQFSGAYPLLAWMPWGTAPTAEILAKWERKTLLPRAQRAQRTDFVFPLAYGALAWLLALGLRRLPPHDQPGGRWVWAVAAGTAAAVFDEVENVGLWIVMQNAGAPGHLVPALAAAAAVLKTLLLAVAAVTFLVAVFRARA